MKNFILKRDDSSHWYLIPETEKDLFDHLFEYDEEEFINIFSKYLISNPYNLIIRLTEEEIKQKFK